MSLTNRITMAALFISGIAGCAQDVTAKDEPGIAVVELFTSQGCSSCPPADALLADIAEDAATSKQNIYCLSFHVDYWNKLGWIDPFSDAAYTKRQQAYSQLLRLRGIYTPQMIVNGTEQFVGSNRANATKAIANAIAKESTATVALTAKRDEKLIDVTYKLQNAPQGIVLNIAWTQAQATSHPNRGENSGRTLTHVNVVRDFRTVQPDATGEGTVKLQQQDVETGTVIAYIQDTTTGRILAAQAIEIAAKP